MDSQREDARRLDAEVRGFVEELRRRQNARRNAPTQTPISELVDLENATTAGHEANAANER